MPDHVNEDGNKHSDEDKRNRLIPHLGPKIDVRAEPTRQRLVVTQAGNQAQCPSSKVQHAVHKSTTVAIQQTQNDRYDKQYIDRVNRHTQSLPSTQQSGRVKHLYELSQFKISNVF